MTREFSKPSDLYKDSLSGMKDLIIHNDDFNTFEFVIETLIEVCDHEPEQAIQCTLIIHNNGKCVVRTGEFATLQPMYRAILDRGISATIN
ncbi:MAG TPA: ATP-dependent Clp protease adaptor ClpS [Bacteroidales bacterium]|nr:ATP-dependent Clp protease adaptor ClpS [Bacteroidales bacterium]